MPVLATRAECAEEQFYLQRELASKDRELSELRRTVREQRLALQTLRTACAAASQACAAASQPAASVERTDAWPYPPPQQTATAASAELTTPGRSRSLLASSSDGRFCSAVDVDTILKAAGPDATKAVTDLLTSNVECAMCIIPCAATMNSAFMTAMMCILGCRHQNENRCDDSTGWGRATALMAQATVSDRATIVQIVQLVEKDCAMCVLETVSSVCGESCLRDGLGLVTDYPVFPRPCAADLAATLAAAQAGAMRATLESGMPFGLHIDGLVTDLFVRTDRHENGLPLYKSVGSSHLMYGCISGSEGETWVISASDDADARSRCEGDVQVALDTAQAHPISGSMDNPPVLQGFRFVGGLEQCAHILHSEVSRRAQIRSYIDTEVGAEVVLFADGVKEQDVACTMLWLLGPYSPVRQDGMQTRLVLPHGLGRIELAGDILVRKGESLIIETEEASASAATTAVVVGERQLRVELDGKLTLVRTRLADSVASSALLNQGEAVAVNATFERCSTVLSAATLVLGGYDSSQGSDDDPPVNGIGLAALGGAVLNLGDHAIFTSVGSSFVGCSAIGNSVLVGGGAIASVSGRVRLERTVVRQCFVEGYGCAMVAGGGAVYAVIGKSIEAFDSMFLGNQALIGPSGTDTRGSVSQSSGGGIMLALRTQNGVIHGSTFENNSVTSTNGAEYGGAVLVGQGATLRISSSVFRGNAAYGNAECKASRGGALISLLGASVEVRDALFEGNWAKGAIFAQGGALYIFGAVVLRSGVVFRSNIVSGQGNSIAGGAVAVIQDDPVTSPNFTAVESPSFVDNVAEGTEPEGGALFLLVGSRDGVRVAGADFSGNLVRVTDGVGRGGAIRVKTGGARLENCSFTANVARMERGSGFDATGGGISISAGGRLELIRARMTSNWAGGTQLHWPLYAAHRRHMPCTRTIRCIDDRVGCVMTAGH